MLRKIFYTTVLLFIFSETIQAQVSFTLPSNSTPASISYAEYFIDTDPGFGSGTSIPVTSSTDISANNYSVNLSSVNPGVHRIYIRTKDANGSWSETNVQTFFLLYPSINILSNPSPVNVVKMEYFIDTDPGFGNGKPISITSSMDVSASNVSIDLTGLSNGVHRIYLRSQDANGSWSETNLQVFNILLANVVIPPNPVAGNITKFEYFFDTDPGFGNGKIISIPSTSDLSNYSFATDLTGLKNDTTHTLYIRTFDDWSLTNTRTFLIGTALPLTWISFNAKAVNKKVALDWITAHEINTDHFDIERSVDGMHFSKIGNVPSSQNSSAESDYTFTDDNPINGISYYRLKQVDIDGHFTYSIIISVKINTQLSVQIIGNPVHQNLHLEINGTNGKSLPAWITDVSGRKYKTVTLSDGSKQINIEDLSSGMYYLVYQSGNSVASIPFDKQ